MKRALIFASIFFIFAVSLPAKNIIGKVTQIIDGDTIVVRVRGKINYTVRLYGVIAPDVDRVFGREAKRETGILCLGKVVRVEPVKKDSYGRLVGRVYTEDATYVNEQLIATGYARYYKKHGIEKRFPLLEETARDGKLGLWAESKT